MILSIEHYIELLSIILGLAIVIITYRAGKISSQKYLYYLAIGFGIIATGSLLEELLSKFYSDFSVRENHLVESIFVDIGLLIIWISLSEENENFEIQQAMKVIDDDNHSENEELVV